MNMGEELIFRTEGGISKAIVKGSEKQRQGGRARKLRDIISHFYQGSKRLVFIGKKDENSLGS